MSLAAAPSPIPAIHDLSTDTLVYEDFVAPTCCRIWSCLIVDSPHSRLLEKTCSHIPGPDSNDIAGILRRMQPRCQRYRDGSRGAESDDAVRADRDATLGSAEPYKVKGQIDVAPSIILVVKSPDP